MKRERERDDTINFSILDMGRLEISRLFGFKL